MPLISATSLRKEFAHGESLTIAVNDVSLSLNQGEKIAIMGPSGCGKTTLMNLLGLISRPTGGSLFLEQVDTVTISEKMRARYRNRFFGYVVQDFALVEHDTVFQNIETPLLYASPRVSARQRRHIVMNGIEQVDLVEKMHVRVRNLSGGQRQRVALARATINNPKVILADEPTGSLDSENGRMVMNLLSQYVSNGMSLILVTHDEALASKCDRKIHMIDGTFVLP